ncbi:hypothetical protein BGZ46_001920 [Entomortierella lignicola]|nr:hypothetical protein BGZ46_001920 [Entomortierella lignicola]
METSHSHNIDDTDTPQPHSVQPSVPESSLYPTLTSQESQEDTLYPSLPLPEEAPPSYEAVLTKDIPQIHDNYEHLNGPPSQRGKDIKDPIPLEYHSSNNSGEPGPSVPRSYPSIDDNYESTSAANTPDLGLRGPIAIVSEEEGDFAQDIDRLLSAEDSETQSRCSQEDDADNSCWNVAGDGHAWAALGFHIIVLLPWTLFCFGWTLAVVLLSSVSMIFPPLGYFCTILSVTSWRALARVDLVLSAALVSDSVRSRYPYVCADIFIAPEPGPAWKNPRIFGYEMPLPGFIERRLRNRHASRSRRPKNLWRRGAKHIRQTLDVHTISSMFYFLVWKMMFGIPVFVVMVILFTLTVPFMICFLPSLLVVSRTLANWQYRWAVNWLTEKPAPVVV